MNRFIVALLAALYTGYIAALWILMEVTEL